MAIVRIMEDVSSRPARTSTKGVLRNVKLVGLTAPKKNRQYTAEALKRAVAKYEGARVNVNHPEKAKSNEPRRLEDRFGRVANARFVEGQGIFGDVHYNPEHPLARQIEWFASEDPRSIGMSHVAMCERKFEGGKEIVESIRDVSSVDIVADPATTAGLYESDDPDDYRSRPMRPEETRDYYGQPALRESVEYYDSLPRLAPWQRHEREAALAFRAMEAERRSARYGSSPLSARDVKSYYAD